MHRHNFCLTLDRCIASSILLRSRRYGVVLRHHRCFHFSYSINDCVGDTIPHVLAAVFPALRTSTFFSFLINRQVVIILCTALVSYPLSLYRDITKLAKASALALVSMVIIVYTVVSEGPNVPAEYRGTKVRLFPSGFGVFQAIGVISFGNLALSFVTKLTRSLCVSPQLAPNLRRFEETHYGSFRNNYSFQHWIKSGGLSHYGTGRGSRFQRQNNGKHFKQFSK